MPCRKKVTLNVIRAYTASVHMLYVCKNIVFLFQGVLCLQDKHVEEVKSFL